MDGLTIHHHVLRVSSVPLGDLNEAAKSCRSLCAPPTDLLDRIDRAAGETDTDPTEAQQAAGNYRKGKLRLHGLEVSIENPKGSTRSGTGPDGKKWSQEMRSHYGYILGTEGRDKDHVDVFIGEEHPHCELVFVVNQVDPSSGRFDEHKCVIGATSEAEARRMYLDNYEDGWQGLGSICPMTMPQFKWWLRSGDTSRAVAEDTFARYRWKAAAVADDQPEDKSGFVNDDGYVHSDFPDRFAEYGPEHRFDVHRHGRNVASVSVMDTPARDRYWVRGLYTSPRHRGKGLARALMQKVIDRFGASPLELHVGPFRDKPVTSPALARFYGSLGFAPDANDRDRMTRTPPAQETHGLERDAHRHQPIDGRDDADADVLVAGRPPGERAGDGQRPGPHGPGPVSDGAGPGGPGDHDRPKRAADGRDRELLTPSPFDRSWDAIGELFEKDAAADRKPTICVDLDGTLAEESAPFDPAVIGKPRRGAKRWMQLFRTSGARLIVWTVRGDVDVVKAWLDEHGIPYDHVNENPDQPDGSSGKVIADVYLDNRADAAAGPWSRFGPEVIDRIEQDKDE